MKTRLWIFRPYQVIRFRSFLVRPLFMEIVRAFLSDVNIYFRFLDNRCPACRYTWVCMHREKQQDAERCSIDMEKLNKNRMKYKKTCE
ncbi:hypothetical protein DRA42_04435 [Ethanoligenens harbinense]|nr:hypothetical protein CXQ68_04435 [Ethanoligenens harbinense YUAN-3]AYF38209.1 hypothetical protein CXP51_04290 [Ethanoligenens harbinense]AYF40954.1 hypothetical protein CN246_04425 [Ethanoligenens harbinense]QCN91787.1 hypothetical protein DRA42_04435 [Ethanoligenens harbinense]